MSQQNLDLFLIGGGFGLLVAVLGGLVEYRAHLKRPAAERAPVAWFLIVAGFLCFLGLVAVALSLFFTSTVVPAVIMGAGVGTGFYLGFCTLLGIWLLIQRLRGR